LNSDASCGWQPRLFSSEQLLRICDRIESPDDWRQNAFREFTGTVAQEFFPCPFAQKSLQVGTQWFIFLETLSSAQLERLRVGLIDYLHVTQMVSGKHRLLLPLVVLVKPESVPCDLAEYQRRGWSVLQYLHDHDAAPWPEDVPQESEHYLWTFCFHGVQIFVNFSSPAHRERRSRNLGSSMAFVINARKNFDVVAGNNPEGDAVRRRVRSRVAVFDGQAPGKELGTYGDPANREWRQYAAAEHGAPEPAGCPLRLGGKAR
jgi:FPC/CPF motif-containing protein YcgG